MAKRKLSDINIKEISYRRLVNLGNYETAAIEVKAELNEGDDPDEVFASLKEFSDEKISKKRGV